MGKTLNELADELKAYIVEQHSDAHNKGNMRTGRYNNLKLSMDIVKNSTPHVVVNMGMSEAEFNIRSGEKINGSLGPEEKYTQKWFSKSSTLPALNECWKALAKERGR